MQGAGAKVPVEEVRRSGEEPGEQESGTGVMEGKK